MSEASQEAFFNKTLIVQYETHRTTFEHSPDGLGHPNLAIIEYQKSLEEKGGIVDRIEGGRYQTHIDLEQRLWRHRRLYQLLYAIVQSPDLHWKRKTIAAWIGVTIDGFSEPPERLVMSGGIEWDYLEERLDEISRLYRGGPPVRNLLGLPIFRANERAQSAAGSYLR